MNDNPKPRPRRALLSRSSCLWCVLLLAILTVTGLGLSLAARRQLEAMRPTVHVVDLDEAGPGSELLPPIELHLDLSVAQLTVRPAEADQKFEISAEYDERHYRLSVDQQSLVVGSSYEVVFRPRSQAFSFLRMKMGQSLPLVVVRVPENQPLRIDGRLVASFAAVEAGGLALDDFALEVDGGAATVSFLSPLVRPMESFSLIGDKGSLEVTGLGNASPRRVVLDQRFGELDIDLRGSWTRDSKVDVSVAFAGGSCWLPDDVVVRGVEGESLDLRTRGEVEIEPTLDLSIRERAGRIVLIR